MDINILYHDNDILVCIKPAGILSEESGMPKLLSEQTSCKEVLCVHRLDRDVGGVMVYALNKMAAAKLSALIVGGSLTKEYLAVIHGSAAESSGTLTDLLFHDRTRNKTFVVERRRKGVKEAVLDYTTLASRNGFSLMKICLGTGRSHQIRVQFASRKLPLAGDAKYGSPLRGCGIALWAFHMSFPWKNAPDGQINISALPPEGSFADNFAELFSILDKQKH